MDNPIQFSAVGGWAGGGKSKIFNIRMFWSNENNMPLQ